MKSLPLMKWLDDWWEQKTASPPFEQEVADDMVDPVAV